METTLLAKSKIVFEFPDHHPIRVFLMACTSHELPDSVTKDGENKYNLIFSSTSSTGFKSPWARMQELVTRLRKQRETAKVITLQEWYPTTGTAAILTIALDFAKDEPSFTNVQVTVTKEEVSAIEPKLLLASSNVLLFPVLFGIKQMPSY